MTTLIVHPDVSVQREKAIKSAEKLLDLNLKKDLSCPDLKILDGKNHSSIGIDDVREFKRTLQFQPYECKHQVGLILQAEALTVEAQNALLKILEEPGDSTIFILTVSNEKSLLPTILSRCRKAYIKESLKGKPEHIFEDLDEDFLKKIEIAYFLQIPIEERFLIIEELVKNDKEHLGLIGWFLEQLLEKYRTNLLKNLRSQSNEIEDLIAPIEKINQTIQFISYNVNKRLALENLILQLEESIM